MDVHAVPILEDVRAAAVRPMVKPGRWFWAIAGALGRPRRLGLRRVRRPVDPWSPRRRLQRPRLLGDLRGQPGRLHRLQLRRRPSLGDPTPDQCEMARADHADGRGDGPLHAPGRHGLRGRPPRSTGADVAADRPPGDQLPGGVGLRRDHVLPRRHALLPVPAAHPGPGHDPRSVPPDSRSARLALPDLLAELAGAAGPAPGARSGDHDGRHHHHPARRRGALGAELGVRGDRPGPAGTARSSVRTSSSPRSIPASAWSFSSSPPSARPITSRT